MANQEKKSSAEYTTKCLVKHNDKSFKKGAKISLTEEEAKPLLAAGAIQPVK